MSLRNEQVVRRAYQTAEEKDIPGFVGCFTEDGTFTDESIEVTYVGPNELGKTVEIYGAAPPLVWHFDLFRLERAEEVWELGIEDAFADGISLIEWPERMGEVLPRERLDIELAFGAAADARTAILAPSSGWAGRMGEFRV